LRSKKFSSQGPVNTLFALDMAAEFPERKGKFLILSVD
jgi:hypothetical protein